MKSNSGRGWVVEPRMVALSTTIVAIVALATLVIVVGVKSVDALSTVALALAILAFVVQIIVFIVDTASAGQQLVRAQELHGSTMTLLSEMKEQLAGTQKHVDQLHSQMVDELKMKAGMTIQNEGSTRVTVQQSMEAAEPALEVASVSSVADTGQNYPPAYDPELAAQIHKELREWPDPDTYEEIRDFVKQVDENELQIFLSLANDMKQFTSPGTSLGPGASLTGVVKDFVASGIAEKIPGWRLATLSGKGRSIARLFTAEGAVPAQLPEDLLDVRLDARARRERLLAARDQAVSNRE